MLRAIGYHVIPGWVLVTAGLLWCIPDLPWMAVYTLAAMASSIWLMYGLWRTLFRPESMQERPGAKLATSGVILIALLAVSIFAYSTGAKHDYVFYGEGWRAVLNGSDPWLDTHNSYGPVHNIFAWLYQFHGALPKLTFSWLLVGAGALASFAALGIQDASSVSQRQRLFLCLILSPFALLIAVVYGLNDVVAAAFMVAALVGAAGYEQKSVRFLAGTALAAGFMAKFYPAIIFPFLCLRNRRIDWSFLAGFAAASLLIFGLAYARWGPSVFGPLSFAADRDSAGLSIFNFSRVMGLNLDRLSIDAMAIGFLVWAIYCYWKRIDAVSGAVIGFAIVLSLYKVGHGQFFLFFFVAAPFVIRYWTSSLGPGRSGPVVGSFLLWLAYLNWYLLEYVLTCGTWEWPAKAFRDSGGLSYAILSIAAAVVAARAVRSRGAGHQHPQL